MKTIRYFKAQKNANLYRKNQKVWILDQHGDGYYAVKLRFRGRFRWINAKLNMYDSNYKKANPIIGDFENIKEILIEDKFYDFLMQTKKYI